jgi:hypothetical protein
MSFTFTIEWPDRFEAVMAKCRLLMLDVMELGGMICDLDTNYYKALYASTSIVVIAFALLFIYYRLVKTHYGNNDAGKCVIGDTWFIPCVSVL